LLPHFRVGSECWVLWTRHHRIHDTSPLLQRAAQGRIEYVNNHFATMLGRQPEDMVGLDMQDILPQPFGLMHPKWMRDQEQRPTRPPPSSCRWGKGGLPSWGVLGQGEQCPTRSPYLRMQR